MECKKGWLTSGAFAALCGTTKETLRHYKDIGLLSPAHQGDNSYFYYDVEQFYDFYDAGTAAGTEGAPGDRATEAGAHGLRAVQRPAQSGVRAGFEHGSTDRLV